MELAIFDLDNTLLGGDSDYLWGRFLVRKGLVDGETYERANQRFYEQYKAGTLDIHEFLRFSLKPLTEHRPETLEAWHRIFMEEMIEPIILPKARALVERHRNEGRRPLIITATNRFVTAPIAAAFGIEDILATDPEQVNGRYTGNVAGLPCFQEGKVERLKAWLDETSLTLKGSWFYSDSQNDLPLLEQVEHPVAVDPDDTLAETARARGWEILSLR
ncbi:histidinol-phosphatase [Thiohalomonas denitrificans]|uniref:Histidinol-phosphatase n=1 Tax=Thiohalomonas denitrificans TaxID=415747 RepID=A0A1G5PML8_9GAMM|nr:HAD family hydrolase [Thiohalomonas denitrificans]SCZ50718.1 HAD-superfamily subfamily IB hydrolase, TIGR01490 [Thiohalomonas denitrificans]